MAVEIREASPADFEAIIRLIPTREELFLVYPKGQYPFTIEQLKSLVALRQELTVACQNGDIIGFANLYDVEAGAWAFVGNVVVESACRGQGIGRQLVTYMMQQAFEKYQVREVRISVFNDNTPALLLYARMQFEPYAVEERIHPSGKRVGLIHMKLVKNQLSV